MVCFWRGHGHQNAILRPRLVIVSEIKAKIIKNKLFTGFMNNVDNGELSFEVFHIHNNKNLIAMC